MKPSQRSRPVKFARYALASSAALGAATAAKAQFTGSYAIGTPGTFNAGSSDGSFGSWTGVNSSGLLSSQALTTATTQVDLSYSGFSSPSKTFSFTAPAATASTVNFDWTGSRTSDGYTGYLVNGSFSLLTGANGSVSFPIAAGETFGFRLGNTYSSGSGSAALTITNFSVSAIPEPGTTGLLAGAAALGFVGLMAHRTRRQRAAAVPS